MLLAIIPWFDPMCGVVALYYGAACWLRDGARRLWLLWKAATLPVSQAADAGPGFALFRGTARGPAACACFYEYVSRIEDLFEEPPRLPGFRLEDDSGSIRVEPGPRPPQVHRSWAHLPLSIVMPRPVYAILCGRVARQLWPNRKLTLCEGDSLCVMGPVHAEGEGAGQDLVAGAPATLRPAMRVGPPVDLAPTGKPFEEVLGMLWPRWRHGTRAQQLVVSHTSRAGMVVRLAGASLRSLAAAAVWITAGATLVFLSAHLCMAR